MQEELFIGGRWRPASDGARITVLDPATAETLTTVANGTVEDGLAAVDAAAAALPGWAATAPAREPTFCCGPSLSCTNEPTSWPR